MSSFGPRRDRKSGSSLLSGTVKTLATSAVVAYGAYKAYEYCFPEEETDQDVTKGGIVSRISSSIWAPLQEEAAVERNGGNYSSNRRRNQRQWDPRTRHRLIQKKIRKCRQESLQAYATFWPALQHAIDRNTDTARKTQELRRLRQESKIARADGEDSPTLSPMKLSQNRQQRQEELWKEIQLETFTRLISTIYGSSLLMLSLTMQLHWVGGQVFLEHNNEVDNETCALKDVKMAHQVMMESHHYMTTQGVPLLVAAVRRAFSSNSTMMEEWTATTFVTVGDLESVLEQVNRILERGTGSGSSSNYSRNWIRFILPDPTSFLEESDAEVDEVDDDASREDALDSRVTMLESLWDLAESPAWQDAQAQAVQIVQAHLREHGWGQVFEPEVSVDADKETKTDVSPVGKLEEKSSAVPVAKLMAPLKTACGLVVVTSESRSKSKHKKNSLLAKIQKLPTVLELGDISFQTW